jgi:hypothetical protein
LEIASKSRIGGFDAPPVGSSSVIASGVYIRSSGKEFLNLPMLLHGPVNCGGITRFDCYSPITVKNLLSNFGNQSDRPHCKVKELLDRSFQDILDYYLV